MGATSLRTTNFPPLKKRAGKFVSSNTSLREVALNTDLAGRIEKRAPRKREGGQQDVGQAPPQSGFRTFREHE